MKIRDQDRNNPSRERFQSLKGSNGYQAVLELERVTAHNGVV